jgi:death-on-curing protein
VGDPRWIPMIEDFLDIAGVVLGSTADQLRSLPGIALAESAIHAPFASYGGTDAYPELLDQAAVLIAHLARNHPLPDGNKRTAFVLTARFLDANGRRWKPEDVDTDASTVEGIASGQAGHEEIVAWLTDRTDAG